MLRDADNWVNAHDYLINQILIYDYSNEADRHKLMMKFWVLDSTFLEEEGILDEDILAPKDHMKSLLNELGFLDIYVRTKNNTLKYSEKTFDQLVAYRIQNANRWVNTVNKSSCEVELDEDGVPRVVADSYRLNYDYELPYPSRPTLLSVDQFEEIYQLYQVKAASGELSSVMSILTSITDYNLNHEMVAAERAVKSYEIKQGTHSESAVSGQLKIPNIDYNYVTEMRAMFGELWAIVQSLLVSVVTPTPPPPTVPGPPNPITGDPTIIPNPITWSDMVLAIAGFPQNRVYVKAVSGDSSHKGILQIGEGYRFRFLNTDGTVNDTIPDPTAEDCEIDNIDQGIQYGDPEWEVSNFNYVFYYVENDADSGSSTSNLLKLGDGSMTNLLHGENTVGAQTYERFMALSERWANLNDLRENRIQLSGTRVISESLWKTLPDHERYLENIQDQKQHYTDILRETCSEFV